MHFFNPVHKMKLLEVVRALETDDETIAAAVEVGRGMGEEVVVIKESPGFITSRVNAMIGNEAFYMLQEGVASAADIDKGRTLGLKAENSGELIRQVGRGFSFHLLPAFESRSGISLAEIASIMGIPPRTLARRKSSGRLTSDESEKLLRLSSVFEQAVELFEG